MRYLLLAAAIVAQAGGLGCAHKQQAQNAEEQPRTKAQRRPLEKQQHEYKVPTDYDPRDRGYDPKTGELITYDHKPRMEVLDEKAGKYAFKWVGYNGTEKTIIYQRKDAVDVVVGAEVSRTPGGQYLYTYEVQNLASSGTYLRKFVIQNFAPDVEPDKMGVMFVGQMSNFIYQFSEGNWISFADVSDDLQIDPGQAVKVRLTSSAPPGLVGCRVAGGQSVLKGVGEDMPVALANLLPGYEEWPWGSTVGPVDDLKTLPDAERAKYILDWLPQFRSLGWITDYAATRYEQHLQGGDLNAALRRVEQDLKAEQITTEVFAIVKGVL